jgi:outer membrane protein OmpA-like peptidoglycan-associated protein
MRPSTSLLLLAAVLCVCVTPRAVAAPTVEAAPNIYGQTGVLRTTSARTPKNLTFDMSAAGFVSVAPDFIVAGDDDFDAFTGGTLAVSTAFLDVFELSLASRAASNTNTLRNPGQFSVGDLYPSFKMGFTFLPVAVGIDVRGHLPTRIDRAGYDLGNVGVTTQGLVTVDLHEKMDIPLRLHLNGGYVFEGGKYADVQFFEQNPNFYNGIDGQLLALAADQWFYDQVIAGLAVEVPLPFVTPFVETWYQTAVGVPPNRGVAGKAYDIVNDAHLTVTPGARISVTDGLTIDVGVDVGVLGNGGGAVDAKKLVDGTPLNPVWAARAGITGTFDPFHTPSSSTSSTREEPTPTNDTKGGGDTITHISTTPTAATSPGRLVGWVTNKEDETIEADLELWDSAGMKPAGRSVGGAFDLAAQPGPVTVVAKADGYLALGASTHLESGGRGRASIVLKKAPKSRKVTLDKDKVATSAKVPFEFKKPRLQSTAEYVLDEVVDVLLRNPSVRVRIDVYAEALASPDETQRLADERAAAVADYLVAHGVWGKRLETKGIALAATDPEKARRVELVVIP